MKNTNQLLLITSDGMQYEARAIYNLGNKAVIKAQNGAQQELNWDDVECILLSNQGAEQTEGSITDSNEGNERDIQGSPRPHIEDSKHFQQVPDYEKNKSATMDKENTANPGAKGSSSGSQGGAKSSVQGNQGRQGQSTVSPSK